MIPRITPLRLEILGYLSKIADRCEDPEARALSRIYEYVKAEAGFEGDLQALQNELDIFRKKGFIDDEHTSSGVGAYGLSTDGRLLLETWDANTMAHPIAIDAPSNALDVILPTSLEVFVSCGSKPHEAPIGDWLYEVLDKTSNVDPYWWKAKSPGGGDRSSIRQTLLNKAKLSDALIGILHFRDPLSGEPATFPLSSYDEIREASQARVPTIVFRQPKVALKGMFLPDLEAMSVTSASEIRGRLNSFLMEASQRKEEKAKRLGQLRWDKLETSQATLEGLPTYSEYLIDIGHTRAPLGLVFVSLVRVENKGKTSVRDCRGWIGIGDKWFQLPWSIPNSDGSRDSKTIHPEDPQPLDVCGWMPRNNLRILPTERGWPNPPRLNATELDGPIRASIKVTGRDMLPLGPTHVQINTITQINESGSTPLFEFSE